MASASSTSTAPIRLVEHFQLSSLGINVASISFSNNLTMSSDKFICLQQKEPGEDSNQLVFIDMEDPETPLRRPTLSDSALLNPAGKIVALKYGKSLVNIYSNAKEDKLKSHEMTEEVIFWKWITLSTIALVTEAAVYHWSIWGDSPPRKMFETDLGVEGAQVISYRTDSRHKWLLLVAIAPQQNRVIGTMQLHSVDWKVSQTIEGHAGAFAQLKLGGNPKPSNLLCVADRNSDEGKLQIFELGEVPAGNRPFAKKEVEIPFPSQAKTDFPVAMQVSSKYDMIYLMTKYGYLHLFDLESGLFIYMGRISPDTIFVTAPQEATGGVIGVTRKGQVLSVTINEGTIIPYIANELSNPDLARRVAQRLNLTGGAEGEEEAAQEGPQQGPPPEWSLDIDLNSFDLNHLVPIKFCRSGLQFKAKFIGILEVAAPEGNEICQTALRDLKMAVKAAVGLHKRKITVAVSVGGFTIRDERTKALLYHHKVHEFSCLAQDETDTRAFGYIIKSPEGSAAGHQFFGIKTEKSANQVLVAMRDLVQVLLDIKKKGCERALDEGQHDKQLEDQPPPPQQQELPATDEVSFAADFSYLDEEGGIDDEGAVGGEEAHPSAPPEVDLERKFEEEVRKLREQTICKICMDEQIGVVFVPCGHLVACVECAKALKDCAICRKTIKSVVKTYLS